MRKTIATLAALTFSITSLVGVATPAAAQQAEPTEASISTYPTCQDEDSLGCVWTADESGNERGLTFLAHTDGTVTYLFDTVPAGWSRLDTGWVEAMAGEDEGRDFTLCVIEVADTTTVVCPDGWTWNS